MPLHITLKPNERLLINGAAIRNGDRSSSFVVETQCRFLREGEILHESEADTACKKLCVTLQVIHLSENATEVEHLFYAQAVEIMRAMPSAAPYMSDIQAALEKGQTYVAVRLGKQLVRHEHEVALARQMSGLAE